MPIFPKNVVSGLREILPADRLLTGPEERACYSYDGSALEHPPAAVAYPTSTEEVSAIMRLASSVPFPVVPRGAGSGMAGGSIAVGGGLILAMNRLNRIIEIDPENQITIVEPGVLTAVLQDKAKIVGLYYPPDPASSKFCSIGGNVATCAGGPSAVKYGVTRDYVLGLEAVLPDGNIINTGVRTAKGVVGYDLTRLLVGSEGTLAVITKIILRLLPQPETKTTFLLLGQSLEQTTAFVAKILKKLTPCTLEYLDRTALGIVKSRIPFSLPDNAEALLLIEFDGLSACVQSQAEKLKALVNDHPEIIFCKQATDPYEQERVWAARRAISPMAFELRPHKISEDVVVPRTRIPDLVSFTERLTRELEVIVFTFGHAGDGNIHVNIMLNRDDSNEVAHSRQARSRLYEKVLSLGGTISGEHGIGIAKSDFIATEIPPPTLRLMKAMKTLFDPHNILNPGKIFPAEDPHPINTTQDRSSP